jgi:hypothetical protein
MGLVTVSPASFGFLPGDTEALSGDSKFADCNYYVYWYDTTSWAWWSSSNTPVVTMDTSVIGQADAQSAGTATATAQYNACGYWYYNPLTLTCTCSNNTSGSGGSSANVQKPGFLYKTTELTVPNGEQCSPSQSSCTIERYYQVLDENHYPINRSGMTIHESVSLDSGNTTCQNVTIRNSQSWMTNSSGIMTKEDGIYYCCNSGSNCFTTIRQHLDVNGYPVLIDDGVQTPGLTNSIRVICSNGQGGCPTITVLP